MSPVLVDRRTGKFLSALYFSGSHTLQLRPPQLTKRFLAFQDMSACS
jgi:hypothetical protein